MRNFDSRQRLIVHSTSVDVTTVSLFVKFDEMVSSRVEIKYRIEFTDIVFKYY